MNINWNDFLNAIALMMIIEGILPFVNPKIYKRVFKSVNEMTHLQIRNLGVGSIIIGLLLLLLH